MVAAQLFPGVNLLEQTAELIASAQAAHRPASTFLLLSGGDDSMVLLDRAAGLADAVVHVNTGIGIEETTRFVRQTCADRGLRYIELQPPVPYDELVLGRWNGFPGDHRFAYGQLKRKAIERFLASLRTDRSQRFLLLLGLRRAESANRKRNYTVLERRGSVVWLNPLFYWTNEEMHEYRQDVGLPRNPVSAEMHMSGECLCGSRARKGERDEWLFWRPEFIKDRIEPLEAECRSRGLRYPRWGWLNEMSSAERRKVTDQQPLFFMPMCVGCEPQENVRL